MQLWYQHKECLGHSCFEHKHYLWRWLCSLQHSEAGDCSTCHISSIFVLTTGYLTFYIMCKPNSFKAVYSHCLLSTILLWNAMTTTSSNFTTLKTVYTWSGAVPNLTEIYLNKSWKKVKLDSSLSKERSLWDTQKANKNFTSNRWIRGIRLQATKPFSSRTISSHSITTRTAKG